MTGENGGMMPPVLPTLLLLHGWGGSKESFAELRQALAGADVRIIAPDLPGFGEERDPPHAWTIDEYAAWVEQELMRRGFDGPIHLLGHSHGGRIAIKMALRGNVPIAHLYLCAAAGIRRPRHLKRAVGWILAKWGRVLAAIPGLGWLRTAGRTFLYKLMRVHDYERASAVMQDTMIKVTAEDLRPHLRHIAVPTDLFWGEDDTMTPLEDGKVMHDAIANSVLHTFPGVRHSVHKDRAREIARRIVEEVERS